MFYEYIDKKELFFFSENVTPLRYPLHIHHLLETVHVIKGELSMQIGQEKYLLHPGDIGIMFPNVLHSYYTPDEVKDAHFYIFNVHPDLLPFFKEELLNKRPQKPVVPSSFIHEDISYAQKRLTEVSYSKDSAPLISSLYSLILSRLFSGLTLNDSRSGESQDLASRIIAYIGSHFTEDITQAYIAGRFGVSKSALSRIFTNILQMNFNYYINSLRINYAKYLLTTSEHLSVTDISYECGYQNQQTFNRIFKEFCGCAPRQYRRENIDSPEFPLLSPLI